MAGPHILILLIYLITISNINTYTVLYRTATKLDNARKLFNRTLLHSSSTFDDCIPVQAVKELDCEFGNNNALYQGLFDPVCRKHELCYTCGMVHGITEQKCDTLARKHMNELCLHYTENKHNCLEAHSSSVTLLQQDLYRTSDFSAECYDKCILNYLYSVSNPVLKRK